MTGGPSPSSPRVSAIPIPERYDLPPRPEAAPRAVQDAYRQTMFLLGKDLALFEEGMNLQLATVAASSPSQFRTHRLAAIESLWSRVFLYLSDACLAISRGSYPTAAPLVRAACECLGAERQLYGAEMNEFLDWLESGLQPERAFNAIDVGLGHYFAGAALAEDERLRSVYRPASDLGRPNFGATLLQVGPESNNTRLALTFGDTTFHLGWAQITLGWLLAVSERQVQSAVHMPDVFAVSDQARKTYLDIARRTDDMLGDPSRCRIVEVDEDGGKRYLVENFRRLSTGAPRKYLL